MVTRKPDGLKKVDLSNARSERLSRLREQWPETTTVNELVAYAFEDWMDVTGHVKGFSHYVTYILDSEGLLLTTAMLDMATKMQREESATVIRTFFQNVPKDTVLGLLTEEVAGSILSGEPSRIYEG